MSRKDKILKNIDVQSMKGIEIGALDRPTISPNEGSILYADHASTDDLRRKYKDDSNVNLPEIVDVDFVLGDRNLTHSVGEKNKFDYVIASHVIEHVPDVISWLQDISNVLQDGGILSLVIPDKRFTFDYFRATTTAGELIESYLSRSTRPSTKQIFDFFSTSIKLDAVQRWNGKLDEAQLAKLHSLSLAEKKSKENLENNEYVDIHCTVYTPKSFFQLIEVLFELDLISFKVVSFFDTSENELEFFVSFQKIPSSTNKEQARFLKQQSVPKIERDSLELAQQKRTQKLEDTINSLSRQNEKLMAIQDSLSKRLVEASEEILLANKRENEAREGLKVIHASTSWQMTAPIRSLKRFYTSLMGRKNHN
ncbi:MAG: hypothetical protein CL568_05075 [Alphaproteobacteria bacterium]|nr:hypothetical protein [Alphaproteobacteria bacterium]PPR13655.1 MAG: hypothetical protein CFH42_01409 [Alphaproteobacteria bacterium MarineAlpha12_Bin1]